MGSQAVIYSWRLSCIILFLTLRLNIVGAGLTTRLRLVREIYPEIEPESDRNQALGCVVGDVVYAPDELVPAEQPCLKCKCQPPGVHCETIKCAKKARCKTIHRPNRCCPDYQCECLYKDRVYANGEKLETAPGEECKVCYCRGGEIQCAEVSCYVRSDCEPKTVPGQCCPKYDHCPPREPITNRSTTPNPKSNPPQVSQITIHEIVPEIKEIPATDFIQTKLITEDPNDEVNDLSVTDSEPESSEISQVFQEPPPVLRIGDKLLFLKKGEFVPEKDVSTPNSVITIIGAEGLQRGFEESAEVHEPTNTSSNDLELNASESTHILSLVKQKRKPDTPTTEDVSTTETTTLPSSSSTTEAATSQTTTVSESTTSPVTTTELVTEVTTLLVNTSSEELTTEESTTEQTLANYERSKESMEESTDSGENTTPTNAYSSDVSVENASVEAESNSESIDMIQSTPEVQIDDEDTSEESNTTEQLSDDVELINATTILKSGTNATMPEDVELITVSAKTKRSSSPEEEAEEVFKQLDTELNVDNTERVLTQDEEKNESDEIFKELLDESSTSSPKPEDKNSEMIKRVTDTIARLTLKGRQMEAPNILGVISNFFGSPNGLGRK